MPLTPLLLVAHRRGSTPHRRRRMLLALTALVSVVRPRLIRRHRPVLSTVHCRLNTADTARRHAQSRPWRRRSRKRWHRFSHPFRRRRPWPCRSGTGPVRRLTVTTPSGRQICTPALLASFRWPLHLAAKLTMPQQVAPMPGAKHGDLALPKPARAPRFTSQRSFPMTESISLRHRQRSTLPSLVAVDVDSRGGSVSVRATTMRPPVMTALWRTTHEANTDSGHRRFGRCALGGLRNTSAIAHR